MYYLCLKWGCVPRFRDRDGCFTTTDLSGICGDKLSGALIGSKAVSAGAVASGVVIVRRNLVAQISLGIGPVDSVMAVFRWSLAASVESTATHSRQSCRSSPRTLANPALEVRIDTIPLWGPTLISRGAGQGLSSPTYVQRRRGLLIVRNKHSYK